MFREACGSGNFIAAGLIPLGVNPGREICSVIHAKAIAEFLCLSLFRIDELYVRQRHAGAFVSLYRACLQNIAVEFRAFEQHVCGSHQAGPLRDMDLDLVLLFIGALQNSILLKRQGSSLIERQCAVIETERSAILKETLI